jgi:hypothetical protein
VNEQTNHPDQDEEEILSPSMSDEALEAAAGTEKGGRNSCGIGGSHCAGLTRVC